MKKGEKAICPVCGKEYTLRSSKNNGCSHDCYMVLYREAHKKVHKKVCANPNCGRQFETTNSRVLYCSETCAAEVQRAKATAYSKRNRVELPDKPCEWCGELFTPRAKTGRFCCKECKKKHHAMSMKSAADERVYPPKICARCGKEYIPESGNSKYCSDECRKAVQADRDKGILASVIAEPCEKVIAKLNRPAKRWAKMSWIEVTTENEYYGFSYPDSQIRAYAGTLPEDYGLKRKKALKYETR